VDLAAVVPSIAGPKRPQDRIPLARAPQAFRAVLGQYAPAEPPTGLDEAGAESFPASDPIAVTGNLDGDRPATFSQDTGLPAGLTARSRSLSGTKPWSSTTGRW